MTPKPTEANAGGGGRVDLGMSGEELNRQNADRLAKDFATCDCGADCEHSEGQIADRIFTELQIAQKRGEVLAKVRAERASASSITDCRLRVNGKPVMGPGSDTPN